MSRRRAKGRADRIVENSTLLLITPGLVAEPAARGADYFRRESAKPLSTLGLRS